MKDSLSNPSGGNICIDGIQNKPLQNVSHWYADYLGNWEAQISAKVGELDG